MSFIDNAENSERVISFLKLSPTARIKDWVLDTDVGPTTYRHELNANFVTSFKFNSTEFTEHESISSFSSSTASRYYFDVDSGVIYADFTGVTPFDLDDFITVDYEIHFSTDEVVFFEDPTDSGTSETAWKPYLEGTVNYVRSTDSDIVGVMPSYSSTAELINVDNSLLNLFRLSTLSRKKVEAWVLSGDLEASNAIKTFTGIVTEASYDRDKIRVNFSDTLFKFDGTFNLGPGAETYEELAVGQVDPRFVNKYIPEVYGVYHHLQIGNLDFATYTSEDMVSTENMAFAVCKHYGTDLDDSTLILTVVSNASASSSRTYFDSVEGLNVGDEIFYAGDNDHSGRIVSVNQSENYVNHSSFSSGSAATVGWEFRRERVGAVWCYQQNDSRLVEIPRRALGSTYYDLSIDSTNKTLMLNFNGTSQPIFTNGSIEGLNATNVIYVARVYGEDLTTGITGETFNTVSDRTKRNSKWHQILYSYLINQVGLTEDEIDTDVFLNYESSLSDQEDIGMAYPKGDKLPQHREVVLNIISGGLHSVYQKSDGLLSVSTLDKFTTSSLTLTEKDIFKFSYSEDFKDTVKKSRVFYGFGDSAGGVRVRTDGGGGVFLPDNARIEPGYFSDTFERSLVSGIFQSDRERSFETTLQYQTDASAYAEKLFYLYGFPYNEYTIEVPIYYSNINLGDVITLEHGAVAGGSGSVQLRVVSVQYRGNSLVLRLWDQAGIEDTEGVF